MKIRIGGVPEHFNYPWHMAMEGGDFTGNNLNIEWNDYPGGTGAMCKDLRENNLDMAVVLTEGIIADIHKGNPSKILQVYVSSPLIWGIHVPAHSDVKSMDEIKNKRYAISRPGSGSHLMAMVHANTKGWKVENLNFVTINNLDGARKAFKENQADVFFWEKFTTKPFVDNGEFRRVGEFPTPWPCFVIAVREEFFNQHKNEVDLTLSIVNKKAEELKNRSDNYLVIARRYGLEENDAKEWFGSVEWNSVIDNNSLIKNVKDRLIAFKII
ncbi:MAG: substrate-binding domain-containing protein [Cytophagaceae bacterium]